MLFEADLERQLLLLARDIAAGTYRHGGYTHRIVNEKKRRDIQVASVRDRVIHRLLYDYMVPQANKRFDPDVWSCRPGKGLHGALMRTQQLARVHRGAWVCRADVRKFFDHVNHAILERHIARIVSDKTMLVLLREVVRSYNSLDRPYWYSHR